MFSVTHIDGVPVICTGVLSKKFGFSVSSDFIEKLGISPKLRDTNTDVYWRASDFNNICELIRIHLNHIKEPE